MMTIFYAIEVFFLITPPHTFKSIQINNIPPISFLYNDQGLFVSAILTTPEQLTDLVKIDLFPSQLQIILKLSYQT